MSATLQRRAPAVWTPRLLAGADAGRVGLAEHLARHGALPAAAGPALVDELERSGLLGRGGAGFPIARKMRAVIASRGQAVLVANGAEGEPVSRKDQLLLSRVPHLVLDGIQLAARAVGATEAHLVVHRGSPATRVLEAAIAERVRAGGDRVPVRLRELPTRYVASEESALVHWLSGGEAKPTFTPPRPFQRGVGGRPTLVNNVETLAQVALIARHGAGWFRSVGDPDEPGTLLVTVAGSVARPGVLEVASGTTVGDTLRSAGTDPAECGAVLVGGYFGAWLDAETAADTPLTHRGLRAAGGALGAGIVVALGPDRCGLAETAHVARYLAAESAGQCGPCLNGLPALADAVQRLALGGWDERLAPAIDRWLDVIPGRGACRHPDGATRFVLSALRVFRTDVEQHRRHGPCGRAASQPVLPVRHQTTGHDSNRWR
jgi:NADH:ubiquinone oxidoreductase subunit F (NADH-binding)